MTMQYFTIGLWGIIGLGNLIFKDKISKFDYGFMWVMLMATLAEVILMTP